MLIYFKFALYTSWMHYMHQVEHNLAISNWNLPTSHQEKIHTKEHTNTYNTYGYIPLHVYTYQYTLNTYQYIYIHTNTHACPNIHGLLSPLRAPWWANLVSCMLSVLWGTLHQNLEGRRRLGSERRRGMLPPSRQSAQKAWKCPLAVFLC